jgi:ABC-type lipoprotein export system ATPase subunit
VTQPPPPAANGGQPAAQITAASGIAELGAEFERSRSRYGEGALVVCDRLVRIYAAEGIEVQALQGLDLLIDKGELTAIVGASGSGKSTLMNILAGLDAPTAGSVRVAGHDLAAMGHRDRVGYRRAVVGFIWQQTSRNLLPYLTARQNVLMPMRFGGVARRRRAGRAMELLQVLGVAHCADRRPEQMSGGEQQRAAIATALANAPTLLLADEPTGELDSTTAREVFTALQAANTQLGATVLVVTHDPAVATQVRRTIAIRDGRTSTETLRHATSDGEGNATHHAVEYALLDRAGRLQLPREMTDRLAMRDRVRLEEEADHIGVWPDDPRPAGQRETGQRAIGQRESGQYETGHSGSGQHEGGQSEGGRHEGGRHRFGRHRPGAGR